MNKSFGKQMNQDFCNDDNVKIIDTRNEFHLLYELENIMNKVDEDDFLEKFQHAEEKGFDGTVGLVIALHGVLIIWTYLPFTIIMENKSFLKFSKILLNFLKQTCYNILTRPPRVS